MLYGEIMHVIYTNHWKQMNRVCKIQILWLNWPMQAASLIRVEQDILE